MTELLPALIGLLAGIAAALAFLGMRDWVHQLEIRSFVHAGQRRLSGIDRTALRNLVDYSAMRTGKAFTMLRFKKMDTLRTAIAAQCRIAGGACAALDTETFIGYQVFCGCAAALVVVIVFGTVNPLPLAAVSVLGFFLPLLRVRDLAKRRHRAVFRQIPDVLDLLTLMIEAGLDFNAALERIVRTEKGPLTEEFAVTLQAVRLGRSRAEAFADMTHRLNYPPLTTVITAITTSLRTGGSLGPSLRALSEQFRTERFQLAEKLAGEAPVKLMIPLIALIFPTIFIILFGPILLSFMAGGYW